MMVGDEVGREDSEKRSVANCLRIQPKKTFVAASALAARVERVMGIEPTYDAWEAPALPLSYTRTVFVQDRDCAGGALFVKVCLGRWRQFRVSG